VKQYLVLARASARTSVKYRLAFALSLFGLLFQMVAMLLVWRILLANRPITGFTWPKMEAYLLIAFSAGTFISLFADFNMSFKIREGTVATDLVKPVDYQLARLAETLGGLWVELLSVAVVWILAIGFVGGIPIPSWPRLLLFLLSMVLLVLLKFMVTYIVGLACFWTKNYLGVYWLKLSIVNLLSGALVPLLLFPHWLYSILLWLPFAGMMSTPGLVYIDAVDWEHALQLVGVQFGWFVLLWIGARLAWRSAVRQLTVHGG
jgi:viologen exporter family transport system permease protein